MSAAPLRVAFDATHARINRTGIGRYAQQLLPALAARDDVDVVGLLAPGTGATGRAQHLLGVARRDFAYYPAGLAHRARAARADVIHCPTSSPAHSAKPPLVMTVHDLLWLRMPQHFTPAVRAYHRMSVPAVRAAGRILADSDATRADVIELLGVPEERVVTAPLAADPRFAPREADRDLLRARFGIERRYVLAVATREPRKNLNALLDAFERLAARVDDCDLVLVGGKGWSSAELERTLEATDDRVKVCGFVSEDELVALYAGATCFAFPSLAEGFGLPVLEAMACGTPVVSSNTTSMPEVTGDAALLVDPTDVEALAAALERLMTEPVLANGLARRGLERAATFSWERCAAETVAAYRQLV
ncbi:glycosyltransferase family 4 protein [Solirubrobacter phytolaccae]|uniref:Glycosyltransferase family 4 protein n=1 Tax=Solirubrobacter phytolaccae TaxID=1404360 RepID=A0A9X3SCW0_9ACTN|nr:glycosyltransferase family 1 protein [Solirubrobacter phytolaccae]MDA0185151.1 glycosyltransferase family 4 protein [Solirubrobacter phytolaccae]